MENVTEATMVEESAISKEFKQLQEHADTIKQDGDCHPVFEPMDEWRQGDVRITRLPEDFMTKYANELKLNTKRETQLAPGTTLGSQHHLDSLEGVTLYTLEAGTPLDGPVIRTTENRTVTHPEHGNVEITPGCYAFPGQRVYAEELRRTAD